VRITAEGVTTLHYSARDRAGNVEDERTLTVRIDRTPPRLECAITPSLLWPPDHKLVAVKATVAVSDVSSGAAGFWLASATSSEPDNGLGDGDAANDVQELVVGTPDVAGKLRAERSGKGPGRTYTLVYEAADAAGNTAQCAVRVGVPHDR
jgi:hypothetical protein